MFKKRRTKWLVQIIAPSVTWQGIADAALEAIQDERDEAIEFAASINHQLDSKYWELDAAHDRLKRELGHEQLQRASAQRVLVPYVRSLEAFDHWLRARPELREQLRPILQELGLWEIELGYDPDRDLTTSVVSPRRF